MSSQPLLDTSSTSTEDDNELSNLTNASYDRHDQYYQSFDRQHQQTTSTTEGTERDNPNVWHPPSIQENGESLPKDAARMNLPKHGSDAGTTSNNNMAGSPSGESPNSDPDCLINNSPSSQNLPLLNVAARKISSIFDNLGTSQSEKSIRVLKKYYAQVEEDPSSVHQSESRDRFRQQPLSAENSSHDLTPDSHKLNPSVLIERPVSSLLVSGAEGGDSTGRTLVSPSPDGNPDAMILEEAALLNGEWIDKLAEMQAAGVGDSSGMNAKHSNFILCLYWLSGRWGIRHIVLLMLTVFYAMLGGLILWELNEVVPEKNGTAASTAAETFLIPSKELTASCKAHGFVRAPTLAPNPGNDGNARPWDYLDAVFYATTIITTIGYGNSVCQTRGCKIFTIFYMIFGIPLFFLTMSDLGFWLMRKLQRLVFRCRRCVRRRDNATVTARRKVGTFLEEPSSATPTFRHPDMLRLNLIPAIIIVFVYIFFAAAIFNALEPKWDYFNSLYFTFVSLTTIGFGDLVPTSHADALAAFALFIVGLALVALCISIAQHQMEMKYLGALQIMETAYLASLNAKNDEIHQQQQQNVKQRRQRDKSASIKSNHQPDSLAHHMDSQLNTQINIASGLFVDVKML